MREGGGVSVAVHVSGAEVRAVAGAGFGFAVAEDGGGGLHHRKRQTFCLPKSDRPGTRYLQPLLQSLSRTVADSRPGDLFTSHAGGAEEAAEEEKCAGRAGGQRRVPGRGGEGL